eukprot:SAG11_NODE_3099_length_2694_cov_1.515607_4_plen_183_part_00
MSSFRALDDAPLSLDRLPSVADVRAFIARDLSSSLREMLRRLGAQLQLGDDDVASFRRDDDPDDDVFPALQRLCAEMLDVCPVRVCACWDRMLRTWPPPPIPVARLAASRHDPHEDGADPMQPLSFFLPDFGIPEVFGSPFPSTPPRSGSTVGPRPSPAASRASPIQFEYLVLVAFRPECQF